MTESLRETASSEVEGTAWNTRAALIGLMVPSIMWILDFSMIRVALPSIRSSFGARADLAAWIVAVYTMPSVILTPLYGRLGDSLGRRRLFLVGITVFLVGTCINLLATDLPFLIAGRVTQGVGAAGIFPLSMAMISQLFPAGEQGRALGTWSSIGGATSVVATPLAGPLIDNLGWRAIFVPVFLVGLVALFFVWRQVPVVQGSTQPDFLRTFDWVGVTLLSAAMASLLFYLSSKSISGVAPLQDWRLLAMTLLLFGNFILWERRLARPFVDLGIFARKGFSQGSFCAGAREFVMNGIVFLMPLYLTDVHGLGAASTGIMLTTHAVALLSTMRLGGLLADRWGSRQPVIFGMSVQVGVIIYFALLSNTADLGLVVMGLVAHGLGAGLALAALQRAAMRKVPRTQLGVAAGLYRMIGVSGMVLGATLGGVLLQWGLDRALLPIDAYHIVFWLIAPVALLGAIVGLTLKE
jgi:EmrB/QacA subfamily drug resistance transporter